MAGGVAIVPGCVVPGAHPVAVGAQFDGTVGLIPGTVPGCVVDGMPGVGVWPGRVPEGVVPGRVLPGAEPVVVLPVVPACATRLFGGGSALAPLVDNTRAAAKQPALTAPRYAMVLLLMTSSKVLTSPDQRAAIVAVAWAACENASRPARACVSTPHYPTSMAGIIGRHQWPELGVEPCCGGFCFWSRLDPAGTGLPAAPIGPLALGALI